MYPLYTSICVIQLFLSIVPYMHIMSDEYYMLEAIKLGEKGRLTTYPNPWVGAIIVKDGITIGRGYHHKAGEPHAEIMAIQSVTDSSSLKNSTLYCTLEPCSHHGRTGPCCEAIMEAGITRCVIGVNDPDHRVSCRGINYLRGYGIEVTYMCHEEVTKSLEPYLHHRQTGRPYVVLKIATSIDGKVACEDKTSQWITDVEARADSHCIRMESQAIIIGSNTAISDNPRLTVRHTMTNSDDMVQPLRVVIDRRGRLDDYSKYHLFDPESISKTLIFTENHDAFQWVSSNITILKKDTWSLTEVLEELGSRGIIQAMVEGGSTLHSSFIEQGLANTVVLYMGSTMLGSSALSWLTVPLCKTISDAKFWMLRSVEKLGNDAKLVYSFMYM
jgi:diaminohydroxyphosphoribosylaminopyrimidine deaminase/5-amino-6-(5-phosphoribosylamino)uracil reductase